MITAYNDGRILNKRNSLATHGLLAMFFMFIVNVPSEAMPAESMAPFPRVGRSAGVEQTDGASSGMAVFPKRIKLAQTNDVELDVDTSQQPPPRDPSPSPRSKRQALIPFPRTGKRSSWPWSLPKGTPDKRKYGRHTSALIPFPRTGKRSSRRSWSIDVDRTGPDEYNNFLYSDTPPGYSPGYLAGDYDFGRAMRPRVTYMESQPTRKSSYQLLHAYLRQFQPADEQTADLRDQDLAY